MCWMSCRQSATPVTPQQRAQTGSWLSPVSGLGCISLKGSSSPTSLQPQQTNVTESRLPATAPTPGGSTAHLDPIMLGGNKRKKTIKWPTLKILLMWRGASKLLKFIKWPLDPYVLNDLLPESGPLPSYLHQGPHVLEVSPHKNSRMPIFMFKFRCT